MPACKLLCYLALPLLLVLQIGGRGICDISSGTPDGLEEWGYIDVREGAHMFWWLYYKELSNLPSVPLVLWIQGGPGASGAGFGNFEEVGPLDINLKPRPSTWLNVAHLLFVDNPVGTGFSYVNDSSLLTTTNEEVSKDLVAFLKLFFNSHTALKKAPFYIVAESYGGKFVSEAGIAIHNGIAAGALDFNFQGVALGDTWISPMDFMWAWGPLLKSVSLIDEAGNDLLSSIADLSQKELALGHNVNATYLWADMEDAVLDLTDSVDFYNFLNHETSDDSSTLSRSNRIGARHLNAYQSDALASVMNGPIRAKLGVIPSSVIWAESSLDVFEALLGDFMLDTIDKVDELLALGVNVTLYSGQLDLICCTTGTEAWVHKLKWPRLSDFLAAKRTPLYCSKGQTQAFVKQLENLVFYWIMNAGHMVPTDNPCFGLELLSYITKQATPGKRFSLDRYVPEATSLQKDS